MRVRFLLRGILLVLTMVCSARAQMTSVKVVFIIVMENKNWSSIRGNSSAPYINNVLLPMASHAEQYYNPPRIHPSLPNYLWLEAGANFGITNDNPPSDNHQSTTLHLVTQLNNAGVSWKAYQEGIDGTSCPLTKNYPYAVKHNPFVYFDDVTNTNDPSSSYCIAHVRPYSELATDLANGAVAQYNFITPNLCNDMHDSCSPIDDPIAQGDTWLSNEAPKILNSSAYKKGGALFITWDEGDGPIGMIVLSPFVKGNSYSNSIHYTHGSTLRTLEEIFGQPFIRDALNQTDLSDLFAALPNPPPTPTNLTAIAGNAQVSLTWDGSSGATGYNVKRSTTSRGPYNSIAAGMAATSYTDKGLTNGTTYFYVVSAVGPGGESANSTEASARPSIAAGPLISAGGVVGAGWSNPAVRQISPNALISIFGQDFALPGTSRAVGAGDLMPDGALPTNLAGVCVAIGDQRASIIFVGPNQLNVQVPTLKGGSGSVSVQVITNCDTASSQTSNVAMMTLQAESPEFFTFVQNPDGKNPTAAVFANTANRVGAPNLADRFPGSGVTFTPAKPGDLVSMWATGLGLTNPAFAAGVLPPEAAPTVDKVTVTIGSVQLDDQDVLYAGVAPGFAGLYQVNVRIPDSVPDGDQPVVARIGGFSTPPGAFLTVKR